MDDGDSHEIVRLLAVFFTSFRLVGMPGAAIEIKENDINV